MGGSVSLEKKQGSGVIGDVLRWLVYRAGPRMCLICILTHISCGLCSSGSRRHCFELSIPKIGRPKDLLKISPNSARFYISSHFRVPLPFA